MPMPSAPIYLTCLDNDGPPASISRGNRYREIGAGFSPQLQFLSPIAQGNRRRKRPMPDHARPVPARPTARSGPCKTNPTTERHQERKTNPTTGTSRPAKFRPNRDPIPDPTKRPRRPRLRPPGRNQPRHDARPEKADPNPARPPAKTSPYLGDQRSSHRRANRRADSGCPNSNPTRDRPPRHPRGRRIWTVRRYYPDFEPV